MPHRYRRSKSAASSAANYLLKLRTKKRKLRISNNHDIFRVLFFLIPCPFISSVSLALSPKRVILIAVTFFSMKAAPSELNSQQKSLREKLLRLALIRDLCLF